MEGASGSPDHHSACSLLQGPRRMEGRLFGRTEAEKRRREELKAKVLLTCERERLELKQCFRKGVFGWCSKEQQKFWDCFVRVSDLVLVLVI